MLCPSHFMSIRLPRGQSSFWITLVPSQRIYHYLFLIPVLLVWDQSISTLFGNLADGTSVLSLPSLGFVKGLVLGCPAPGDEVRLCLLQRSALFLYVGHWVCDYSTPAISSV